jgi:PPP family 3-phenylpropionic acid transporter
MRHIQLQFFLTFCMLGTVGPFASVFFRERGLTERQLGFAFAIQNLVGVLSPTVMTLVADAKVDARRVLALMSVLVAAGLAAMTSASGAAQVMLVWGLYCIAQTAIFPLQDGAHFSLQRRAAAAGRAALPYHRVRVWGALGYMTPGVVLYYPLKTGSGLGLALACGAVMAVLAAGQALLLPDVRPPDAPAGAPSDNGAAQPTRLPTLAAARMLFEPRMLVFCVAIVLVYMAFSIHWTFYAVYLTEHVRLGNEWVGVANNVAMCVEIPVTFLCGWFVARLGVKRLVAIGMLLMALRLGLIASTNNPFVAIGTQAFHAFLILAVSILPHTILDQRAGDRFRHSMQALFVVMVSCGNALANLWAGWMATRHGLHVLFAVGAGLCVAAAALIALSRREDEVRLASEPPTAVTVAPPTQPL